MTAETPANAISWSSILNSAMDGIFVLDLQRRYVSYSAGMERLTGFMAHEMVGNECPCFEILDCRDQHDRSLSSVLCPSKTLADSERTHIRQRMLIRRKDGARTWVETVYVKVPGSLGGNTAILGIMRDINEVKAREDELIAQIEAMRAQGTGAASTEGNGGAQVEPAVENSYRLDPLLARHEKDAILKALDAANSQRNKAAQLMGISRSRLYRRMEALGINPKEHT